MFDTVIFDLDGTLSDNSAGITKSIVYALERMGRPIPNPETLRRFIGPPLMMSYIRYCGMSEEEALTGLHLYRERFDVTGYLENDLYPGVRGMLTALKEKGVSLAIATGKPTEITVSILKHFGIFSLFDEVVGSSPESLSNEKADMIRQIMESHPGKAVMVGDTYGDLCSAKDAGIDFIYARYGFGDDGQIPEGVAMVQSVDELSERLLGAAPAFRAPFISLEGLDGCGKTTVAHFLRDWLRHYGYPTLLSREPGGCPISENIRSLLLSTEHGEMTATTEALLYAASRYQHVTDVILPAIRRGQAVICDRYVDSSLAYQGMGRELGMDTIRAYNRMSMDCCMPDITVYLRLDTKTSLSRRLSASEPDRIEREKLDFFERVRAGFEMLSAMEPERYLVIDASQPVEQVIRELKDRLPEYMKRGGFLK